MIQEQDDLEREPILNESTKQIYDWETFKKQYYLQENILQSALKILNENNSDISRKLVQLEKSDPICEEDEMENKKQFQSIDIKKYFQQLEELNSIMQTMSNMLNSFSISPEEVQSKLKNNMLKRFKEIHQEHEKEAQKLKSAIQINQKKYELFKESVLNQNGQEKKNKYNRDFQLNDLLNNRVQQASHVIDIAQNIHANLQNQGFRLNNISHKVTEFIGQFDNINDLIRGIRYHRNKNKIILIGLIIILFIIVLYQIV